ncbi:MAG: periplasmic heavy metal sensor [Desulfobulbaceae bacterium]|nr:periplasmic heavy metal sensor [Desulfobulbaceae bacterium]
MNRILIFAIGFVFVLATSGFAMHHSGMKSGGMHHGNKWWQKPAVAAMINLSAEEESQLNDMWVQHRRKMIKMKGNLHIEKFELDVLDDKMDFDPAAFRAQFEKMQKASAETDAERMNYRVEVRSFLGSDRFFKIRSHFPMHGKGKMMGGKGMMGMKGGKGMMGGKGGCCKMMGLKRGKGMMDMKSGKGMMGMKGGKGGCGNMKGAFQGQSMGSSETQSDSQ